MRICPTVLGFAACALIAVGPAFSQSLGKKPSKQEPPRVSGWSAVNYPDGSAPRGKLMYDRFCTVCHGAAPAPPPGASGIGKASPAGPGSAVAPPTPSGTAELQVKYGGEAPAELEKRTDLTPETVILFVRRGVGVMPGIRKTELSDADLKSIADYLARAE